MPMIASFGQSDPGLIRPHNEDSFVIVPEADLLAVADGMGGAAAGEVASRIFIETASMRSSGSRCQSGCQSEQETLLRDIFRSANENILNHTRANPHCRGMGCTAELIIFTGQGYILGHVGDSRTYLLRAGHLKQLTRDHSLVQDQLDQGLIKPDEVRKHPFKHVILRAVGIEERLALDVVRGKTLPGDLFLLCTDGLTDMIDDSLIKEILLLPLTLAQKGNKLIESAKAAGGRDNITVVLGEIT
ncbi:MAG: Stp1/IreP family PP2C-type Ser/Thr phosphatase [bacterium]